MAEKLKRKSNLKFKYFVNYVLVGTALVLCIILGQAGMLSRSALTLLPRIAYSIILAVSLNLVVGFLGELSLGHAGFMCVGAYIGCYFANYLHTVMHSNLLILILSMLLGGACAAVFGFVIGLPALRLKGDYLAIVTLAFGEIVRNVVKNLPMFGGAMGLNTTKYPSSSLYIVAFVVVLAVLFLIQNLIRASGVHNHDHASLAGGKQRVDSEHFRQCLHRRTARQSRLLQFRAETGRSQNLL